MPIGSHYVSSSPKMRLILEREYENTTDRQVMDIDSYELFEDFPKDGWYFKAFVTRQSMERGKMAAETYINFNTTTANTTYVPKGGSNMKTKVVEQAAGFVGTVLVVIDGRDVPVADTKPYKTYDKAGKAVEKLALDVVKNGVSQ